MEEPTKPNSLDEILAFFPTIGQPGWAERTISRLEELGVPRARTFDATEILRAEKKLGCEFPHDLKLILGRLGALQCGDLSWLEPSKIEMGDNLWFFGHLSVSDQERASRCLLVAEVGSDDYFAYDQDTRSVVELRHDPPGLTSHAPTIAHLLRYDLLSLHIGQYGWPDADVCSIVEDAMKRWSDEWGVDA